MTTEKTLSDLLALRDELGIQATTIGQRPDGKWWIDWNGDVELYDTVEDAAAALREVAKQ